MEHLLLLHGAIGSKQQLEPLAQQLSGEFTLHLLNFSGHGGAPFANGFSIAGFAHEVKVYLEQRSIDQAHIFGYSMGGYVALYLAKNHPASVKRIITLATKFQWDVDIAQKEATLLNAGVISEKLPHFARQLELRHLPNDWKVVLEKTKEMLLGLGAANALQPGDYASIVTPCLILLGDRDNMVTPEETKTVAGSLPNAVFKLLPGTGHPIEKISPDLLAKEIKDFLKDAAAAPSTAMPSARL